MNTYVVGRILGWLIVTGYTLTILNYFVKRVNRRFFAGLPADSPARKRYTAFMRFIVRYHRFFAIFTSVALAAHFTIQYLSWGFYKTGVIAGSLLVIQSFLGAFGTYVKKKKAGLWLYAHRTIAILLFTAILLHVLKVTLGLPIL